MSSQREPDPFIEPYARAYCAFRKAQRSLPVTKKGPLAPFDLEEGPKEDPFAPKDRFRPDFQHTLLCNLAHF